jgi:hypothetical protein
MGQIMQAKTSTEHPAILDSHPSIPHPPLGPNNQRCLEPHEVRFALADPVFVRIDELQLVQRHGASKLKAHLHPRQVLAETLPAAESERHARLLDVRVVIVRHRSSRNSTGLYHSVPWQSIHGCVEAFDLRGVLVRREKTKGGKPHPLGGR